MRLARSSERLDGGTAEAALRHLAQELADLAADLEGGQRRVVPQLAVHALADQVIVLAHDVVTAAEGSGRREALVDDVHQRLVALRRSL